MNKGELEDAIRRAQNIFDEWNAVTGFFEDGGSYIHEIRAVIEDAVHCGAQGATKDYRRLECETRAVFRMTTASHRAGKGKRRR